MSGPSVICPMSCMERLSCGCEDCCAYRAELAEKFWEDERDREWERREASRKVDKEYVDRRMPYNDTPKRGWWE